MKKTENKKWLTELTERTCRIALEGGDFLRQERIRFRQDRVEEKGAHNYVSYVDKESERRITEKLHELLPEAGFIVEEGSRQHGQEEYCWIVDPLDGTTNYIHDMAPYAISIALCNRKEILLGVVYEICRDELFYAFKEGGAFLSTRYDRNTDKARDEMIQSGPIHVADTPEPDKASVCIGLPYDHRSYSRIAENLMKHLYGQISGLRILGSAAAELCYVAAGRFDGFIESYIGPWDVAAGSIIVREAGGRITDYRNTDIFYNSEEVAASNGKIHDFLLKVIDMCRDTEK